MSSANYTMQLSAVNMVHVHTVGGNKVYILSLLNNFSAILSLIEEQCSCIVPVPFNYCSVSFCFVADAFEFRM